MEKDSYPQLPKAEPVKLGGAGSRSNKLTLPFLANDTRCHCIETPPRRECAEIRTGSRTGQQLPRRVRPCFFLLAYRP